MSSSSIQFLFFAHDVHDPFIDFITSISLLSKMESIRTGWGHYYAYDRTMSVVDTNSALGTQMSASMLIDRVKSLQRNCSPDRYLATTTVELTSLPNETATEEDLFFVLDVCTHRTYSPCEFEYPWTAFATLRLRPLDRFQQSPGKSHGLLEQRTDMVLQHLAMAISALSPVAVHAYDLDSATAWPINSFLSYYSSPRACRDEIQLILSFWPSLKAQLVRSPHLLNEEEWLSFLRTASQREELKSQLDDYSSNDVQVLDRDVMSVCRSHHFDIVDRPESNSSGFTVLEYPAFWSKYTDAFLFAVLAQARMRCR